MAQENKSSQSSRLARAKLLVKHIEQDPNCQCVVEATKQGKFFIVEEKKWWQRCVSIFIASEDDFYGKAKVTDRLKQHAKLTAFTNTTANIVDFVTNASLYILLVQFLGNPSSIIVGLLLDAGILAFSNNSATIAANRNPKNRSWANAGLTTLIVISFAKTVASGIGMEILNNQDKLQQWKAQQLIEQKEADIEKLNSHSLYKEEKAECEKKEKQFYAMPKDAPGRDRLHIHLWGTWAQKDKDWSNTPLEQLPLCYKARRLEAQAKENYQRVRAEFERELVIRSQMGNDFEFVKKNMPIIYGATFDERGNFLSVGTQVEVAMYSFFDKLVNLDFAGLGLNSIVVCISAITSFAAVAVTLTYVRREDVLESHDQKFIDRRDRCLNQLWSELVNKENHQSRS